MERIEDKIVTLEELQTTYADQRVEVINGEVVPMSPNTRGQPYVTGNLSESLGPFVRKHKLGRVFVEATFVLDGNPRKKWVKDSRMPDASFISRERVEAHNVKHPSRKEPWWLAPDIAVEVISPTDSYSDVLEKVTDYLRFGVRLIWIVDQDKKTVTIHSADLPLGKTLHENDTLEAAPVIEGWSMVVADLFAD